MNEVYKTSDMTSVFFVSRLFNFQDAFLVKPRLAVRRSAAAPLSRPPPKGVPPFLSFYSTRGRLRGLRPPKPRSSREKGGSEGGNPPLSLERVRRLGAERQLARDVVWLFLGQPPLDRRGVLRVFLARLRRRRVNLPKLFQVLRVEVAAAA